MSDESTITTEAAGLRRTSRLFGLGWTGVQISILVLGCGPIAATACPVYPAWVDPMASLIYGPASLVSMVLMLRTSAAAPALAAIAGSTGLLMALQDSGQVAAWWFAIEIVAHALLLVGCARLARAHARFDRLVAGEAGLPLTIGIRHQPVPGSAGM